MYHYLRRTLSKEGRGQKNNIVPVSIPATIGKSNSSNFNIPNKHPLNKVWSHNSLIYFSLSYPCHLNKRIVTSNIFPQCCPKNVSPFFSTRKALLQLPRFPPKILMHLMSLRFIVNWDSIQTISIVNVPIAHTSHTLSTKSAHSSIYCIKSNRQWK